MAKKAKKNRTQAKAVEDIASRVKSVDEVNKFAKVLVYGRNKNGKTVFGSKWPKALFIDVNEEGTRSAAGSGSQVLEANTFDDVAHAYWYLKAGKHPHKTVVIDTITALHAASLRKVLGDAEDRDPTREPSTPDRRTYGRANQLVNQILLDFRNLPMHVVFLSQEKLVVDEEGEEPTLHTIQLTPGCRTTALGCVGLIGRIYLKEVKEKGKKGTKWEARMLVGPHEEYDTGNRIELPRIIRAEPKTIIKAWATNPPDDKE